MRVRVVWEARVEVWRVFGIDVWTGGVRMGCWMEGEGGEGSWEDGLGRGGLVEMNEECEVDWEVELKVFAVAILELSC